MNIRKLKNWKFERNNDELIKLVLEGKKTGVTSLYNSYTKETLPKVGDIKILTFENEKDLY